MIEIISTSEKDMFSTVETMFGSELKGDCKRWSEMSIIEPLSSSCILCGDVKCWKINTNGKEYHFHLKATLPALVLTAFEAELALLENEHIDEWMCGAKDPYSEGVLDGFKRAIKILEEKI